MKSERHGTDPTPPHSSGENQKPLELLPIYQPSAGADHQDDTACCGPPAGPPSSPHDRPGYTVCPFVAGFIETPAGPVPRVKTRLTARDRLGALRVRIGLDRNAYKVAPGLYAVGDATADSAVLVTANYKLSFDHLRGFLGSDPAWLLVLDTHGINVWCAAGKGTFSTRELIRQVWKTRLASVVRHRSLIVPQLGATGVAARKVKKACGFTVYWGPVRARDLPAFLSAGARADDAMRQVTFSWTERLVLVPVELFQIRKMVLWAALVVTVLSGIGPGFYDFEDAVRRGMLGGTALLGGIISGAVAVPLLLPWLPGRAFAVKGALMGALTGILIAAGMNRLPVTGWAIAALVLLSMAVSSYLAMNFTGSTPFTSPSGVEKEMRVAIPLQLAALAGATSLWLAAAFVK